MAELPILPLKVDALLADTGHMTAEEFGAYCRILFVMWRHKAILPNVPEQLQRIAGVTGQRWGHIKHIVMEPLTIANGMVSQKRLTSTWLDVQEIRRKRAVAGRKGNLVQHGKIINPVGGSIINWPKPLK